MNRLLPMLAGVVLAAGAIPGAGAAPPASGPVALDALLQQFRADAPPAPVGRVTLDAWVEPRGEGQELVIVLEPEGETKLNADPGITVTPGQDVAVTWQVPVPHRQIDTSIAYFEPPATVRLPFTGGGGAPIEVLVEYAYCVVDYQCFFGEETLRVVQAGM